MWWKRKKHETSEQDEDYPVTVHIRGPGIIYVDSNELMRAPKVQRLFREAGKLVREDIRRHRESRKQ